MRKFFKTRVILDSSNLRIGEFELTSEEVKDPFLVEPVTYGKLRKPD
jgi:hypothetical protein